MTTVLHVISGLGLGGAERMLTEMVVGLKQRDFVQHVVSLRGRGRYADVLEAAGISVTPFDIGSIWQAVPAVNALRHVVRRIVPDVIQGWMYHGDLAATVAHVMTGGRSGRRLCWNIRASNMDARYANITRLCGWLSGWPDAVIANSDMGAGFHMGRGYHPRRLMIIPNGIDTERFRPDASLCAQMRRELGLDDRVVAIHVARVDPMKDHDNFLAAMADVPEVQGLLVGEGTETLRCPPNVRALGARNDVERYYAVADLVVSSSAFGEGFSNVLAEGMSAGLVPIATDVGDAARIVDTTGTIVPPRNPGALAAAIKSEAALPAEQRRARGLNARARIVAHFNCSGAIDAYAQLYREMAAAKSR